MGKSIASRSSLFLLVLLLLAPLFASAQNPKTIKLNEPNKKRGLSVMEALAVRASANRVVHSGFKCSGSVRPAMGSQRD
jgi:hypothetical protein